MNFQGYSHLNKEVKLHLEAGYEYLAAVIACHLALLDQRDRSHQSLNCRRKFTICSVLKIQSMRENSLDIRNVRPYAYIIILSTDLNCPGNSRAGNCSVSAHNLLKLWLGEAMWHLRIHQMLKY